MQMPEVQEDAQNETPLDWFGNAVEVLPTVPDPDSGNGDGLYSRRADGTASLRGPKADGMTVGPDMATAPVASAAPASRAPRPFKSKNFSVKPVKHLKMKGVKTMPVKMKKMKGGYTNSTPGGVKGKGMTLRNAKAQEKLLNALDHGWKKPKKSPEW